MNHPRMDRAKARAGARNLAAFGLASGLSIVADRAAEAGIVYGEPASPITVSSVGPNLAATQQTIDVDGINLTFTGSMAQSGNDSDYYITVSASSPANPKVGIDLSEPVGNGSYYADPLTTGAPIPPSTFSGGAPLSVILGDAHFKQELGGGTPGNYGFAGQTGVYLGLKFDLGSGTQYAWVSINDTVSSSSGVPTNQTISITGWAYQDASDPGATFDAGDGTPATAAVPEPASLLQLAMGAAGLASLSAIRRRRKMTCGAN